jgi:hypothetical protein
MAEEQDERLWLARLRWRLRGAWTAPAFVALTVLDALVLHWLPWSGDGGVDVLGAVLLAGFLNLALVALVAPFLGVVLRRRAARLPLEVLRDRCATGLMLALAAGVFVGGVLHRGGVADAGDAQARQLLAARAWVGHQPEGAAFRRGIGYESTWKQSDDFFRTCFPGPDPDRNLCLWVDTSGPVTSVQRDADQRPNSVVAGPDNPGRVGG